MAYTLDNMSSVNVLSRSHLYPSNGFHAPSGLGKTGITGSLPALPDGIFEVLRLLPKLLEFVHGAFAFGNTVRSLGRSVQSCARLALPHLCRVTRLPHQLGVAARHFLSNIPASSLVEVNQAIL